MAIPAFLPSSELGSRSGELDEVVRAVDLKGPVSAAYVLPYHRECDRTQLVQGRSATRRTFSVMPQLQVESARWG